MLWRITSTGDAALKEQPNEVFSNDGSRAGVHDLRLNAPRYKDKPFRDRFHESGPQVIPGAIQSVL